MTLLRPGCSGESEAAAASALQRIHAWNAHGEWSSRATGSAGNPGIGPPTIFRNGFEGAS